MAKPRPVTGIDPGRRLRPNARRILAVRIDEVYSYDKAVHDPRRVRELHDQRIGFKRLRYLLEIFAIAFPVDLEPYVEEVKGLQDLLGEIHDRDVQVPMLEEHLAWLDAREAETARALLQQDGRRRVGAAADPEARYQRFRKSFVASRRQDERPGILALIARRRRERVALYESYLAEWRRLKGEGFRERLEAAVGVSRPPRRR